MTFRIMTFNVKGAFFNDGENNWEHRYPLNLQVIHDHKPDLIGFQEVQTRNLATYDEHLTDYAYVLGPETARENSTGRGYFNAIYWNPQRFEKLADGNFFLSKTPDVYSRDWEGAEVRGVNWVRLRDFVNDQVFLFLNSHFPHDSELARMEAVGVIMRQLDAWGDDLPVIIVADFNSRAEDRAQWEAVPAALVDWVQRSIPPAGMVYQRFLEHDFVDTFIVTGHEPTSMTNTYHHFLGENFPPLNHRIDWILTRDGTERWHTQSCEIITQAAPPLYPSDHYPVLAVLELL